MYPKQSTWESRMSETKEIIFDYKARSQLLKGIQILCDAVSVTLGPSGLNIGVESSFGAPEMLNNGHCVAKEIGAPNQYQDMGVDIGKDVAAKIRSICGDGATTGVILFHQLVVEGVKSISTGINPIQIKRSWDEIAKKILQELDKASTPLQTSDQIEMIATASSAGNKSVGKWIREAFEMAGPQGIVTVEEGDSENTQICFSEGMQISKGFLSAQFIKKSQEKKIVELDNPRVLLLEQGISNIQEIIPLLNEVVETKSSLLIIAGGTIDNDVLSTLTLNHIRGTLPVCAIAAPEIGDARTTFLEDVAVFSGGHLVSTMVGLPLNSVRLHHLGSVEKAIIDAKNTTLRGGKGDPTAIKKRLEEILSAEEDAETPSDKEVLEKRKLRLSNKVASIRVGAPSETEVAALKSLLVDSLSATYSAKEKGILPGGATSLVHAAHTLSNTLTSEELHAPGVSALLKACSAPFRHIVANAGVEPAPVLYALLQHFEKGEHNMGFNSITGEIEDIVKSGIVDPVKTIHTIVKCAVSAASIVLLTEALIGKEDKKEHKQ